MPQENNQSEIFNEALALQQKKDWDAALQSYQRLLDESPKKLSVSQASATYHNMSTIAYEKGDLLKAYTWSKKAVFLNPDNQPARDSFAFYSKNFEVPFVAHQILPFDQAKKIVSFVSLDVWCFLSVALLLTTLWLSLKKFIFYKRNQLSETFLTPAKWPVYLLAFVTVIILSATILRYTDSVLPRAIVSADKAQIQTAPGENKPVIFEAPAGIELEVLNSEAGYFQVRFPGAFSGWVSQSQIELLSLSFGQK